MGFGLPFFFGFTKDFLGGAGGRQVSQYKRAWAVSFTTGALIALLTDEVEYALVDLPFMRSDGVFFNEDFFGCCCLAYCGLII